MATLTATCLDCDGPGWGWRGLHAHDNGMQHEDVTGHCVWYDEDPTETELDDWNGPMMEDEEP